MSKNNINASNFLSMAHEFQLGELPTEMPHPKTLKLSSLAKVDLNQAIDVLKSIDIDALSVLTKRKNEIENLKKDAVECINNGGRIFLCGCGATGRLSLAIEYLSTQLESQFNNKMVSFMAGGDVALVSSLEGFEDFPEYGARHLKELRFGEKDLLISSTEGGETPYVIGATEQAQTISNLKPYFLYCNPDESLKGIERSNRVIQNSSIKKVNLSVGPMALSGSTRMQASTILMAAIGFALFSNDGAIEKDINSYIKFYSDLNFSFIKDFIHCEYQVYAENKNVIYQVDDLGLTVFTDTTERAPTFNLDAFENQSESRTSLCYVVFKDTTGCEESWNKLLNRKPRVLNWPEISPRTTLEHLYQFDFGRGSIARREKIKPQSLFNIHHDDAFLFFELEGLKQKIDVSSLNVFLRHLVLKKILNIHSTLIMGKMNRYESNLMTWVSPSNSKLIDRSVRYIRHLFKNEGKAEPSYEEVVHSLFECLNDYTSAESIVLKTKSLLEAKTT